MSDDDLLRRLGELVSDSRRVEADLVSHIGEVDDRRLYAREVYSSMFAYCTGSLHLSEAEAYLRITVARAARKHAVLLEMLRDGRLHLRAIALLAPLLTAENRDSLLRRATHLSKREVEELVAELSPRPDVASRIRKLPEKAVQSNAGSVGNAQHPPAELCPGRVDQACLASIASLPLPDNQPELPRAVAPAPQSARRPQPTEPLSPGRYKMQFTASADLKNKIDRLAALMRSEVPNGDLGGIVERLVSDRLERLEARRFGKTNAPRSTVAEADTTTNRRTIPAAIRRAVHERDGGRCAYVNATGRRCTEHRRLEFHHRLPFGMGGDHRVENVSLLCRAHNAYIAELDYGRSRMRAHDPTVGLVTSGPARPRPQPGALGTLKAQTPEVGTPPSG